MGSTRDGAIGATGKEGFHSRTQTTKSSAVERVKGIEPSYAAWEAAVLPLNYARDQAPSLI